MNIYYHYKDLDGISSAAILKTQYPDAKFIGYHYKENIDFEFGVPVIMVDVSLPMDDMMQLAHASGYKFTWIDHHASAIAEYNKKKFELGETVVGIEAILQDGIAACEITWNHIYPHIKMPRCIELLGEYDTWRNTDKEHWENEVLPFQYGMREICNSLDTFPTELLYWNSNDMVNNIINKGKTILNFIRTRNETLCKRAFEMDFKGYRAICLNGGEFNSNVFLSVYDEKIHDIMIPFCFNGKNWDCSIYTTKDIIDCGQIAKSLGGGGHKKAAGFQVDDIRTIFPHL